MELDRESREIRERAAALIGDESRNMPLFAGEEREGAAGRMIRKSEDLPVWVGPLFRRP
jgi:hypothetical protein